MRLVAIALLAGTGLLLAVTLQDSAQAASWGLPELSAQSKKCVDCHK